MSADIVLIYATAPSMEIADKIAGALIDQQLIACANIIPGMRSHYVWEGKRQIDDEVILILKTRTDLANAVIAAARPLHPYKTPAFVILPTAGAHPPFAEWIAKSTIERKSA
jgi:periplasmic divalent cation tolerance protein